MTMHCAPGGSWRTAAAGLLALVGLAIGPRGAQAQVFTTTAGSSSLADVHGGTLAIRSGDREFLVGAGVVRGHPAFQIRATFVRGRDTVTLGDNMLDVRMPAPLQDGGRTVGVRGARLAYRGSRTTLSVAAGLEAQPIGTDFLQSATTGRPLIGVMLDRRLSSRLTAFSRLIWNRSATAVAGLTWQPVPRLLTSVAAGASSGRAYATAGARGSWDWGDLTVQHGGVIQRQPGMAPTGTTWLRDGTTVVARVRRGSAAIEIGQDDVRSTEAFDPAARSVLVQRLAASGRLRDLRLSATAYRSVQAWGATTAALLGVSRRVGRNVEAEGEWADTFGGAVSQRMGTVRVRATLGPRLSLQQTLTSSNGRLGLSFGGSVLTNVVRIDVSQQTVVTPAADRPFVQALSVNVHLNAFAGFQFTGATHVTPDGRVRFSASVTRITSRGAHAGARSAPAPQLGTLIVRGLVLGQDGAGVGGAVLRLGQDLVVSDQSGAFFLRTRRNTPLLLQVLVDEFFGPYAYRVIRSPATVTPAADGREQPVLIEVEALVLPPLARGLR
jgi:hypothetical protein